MAMQRFGEDYVMEQERMDTIASYMDDEKREQVHAELHPVPMKNFWKGTWNSIRNLRNC